MQINDGGNFSSDQLAQLLARLNKGSMSEEQLVQAERIPQEAIDMGIGTTGTLQKVSRLPINPESYGPAKEVFKKAALGDVSFFSKPNKEQIAKEVHDFLNLNKELRPNEANYFKKLDNARDNRSVFDKTKSFDDLKYSHEQPVRVSTPDGEVFENAFKGLNQGHALQNARYDYPGYKVEPIDKFSDIIDLLNSIKK